MSARCPNCGSMAPADMVGAVCVDPCGGRGVYEQDMRWRWEVQTRMGSDWENCWHEDDHPQTFANRLDALTAIDQFFHDLPDHMREQYSPEDYRVWPCEGSGWEPIRFSFDLSPTWEGFTDGSTWNGWANVWVTRQTHVEIVAFFRKEFRAAGYHGNDLEEQMQSFYIDPDEDGLVRYANGFCTTIEDEDEAAEQ